MGCGAGVGAHASLDTERPPEDAPLLAGQTQSYCSAQAAPTETAQVRTELGETPATVPAVSSTSVPSLETIPAPTSSSESKPDPASPAFSGLSRVLIKGIEKKPELNGQIATIVSYDGGAEKRYKVRVNGSLLSLRESKLFELPFDEESSTRDCMDVDTVIAECSGISTPATTPAGRQGSVESFGSRARKTMPLGELTATDKLIPTYHWVEVPAVASLPPGMEVKMPVGGTKCARIPETWRLQIVAEGQVDSYRRDVGKHTPVIDVIVGAAAAFGWGLHDLELRAEGCIWLGTARLRAAS